MNPIVEIYVFARPDPLDGLRAAKWAGTVDWPGAPRPGDPWFHCGGWAAELLDRVSWCAPVPAGEPGLTIEVRASVEVLAHLVEAHGFIGIHAERAEP